MKEEQKRSLVIGGVAVALIVVAGFIYFRSGDDTAPPVVTSGIYYTGPMKSKNESSNTYGTVDGGSMTAAEAKAAAEKWEQENLQKK